MLQYAISALLTLSECSLTHLSITSLTLGATVGGSGGGAAVIFKAPAPPQHPPLGCELMLA